MDLVLLWLSVVVGSFLMEHKEEKCLRFCLQLLFGQELVLNKNINPKNSQSTIQKMKEYQNNPHHKNNEIEQFQKNHQHSMFVSGPYSHLKSFEKMLTLSLIRSLLILGTIWGEVVIQRCEGKIK